MNRMILGTVQLGLPYGVNNKSGKPQKKEAMKMLEYAYQSGIRCIDTASAYGDSETTIGEYIKQSGNLFKICTKLPVLTEETKVIECCEQSRNNLNIDTFFVYYIHHFDGYKSMRILKQLVSLKEKGMIQAVGVSIYEPEELDDILNHMSDMVDVVQLPFNLLDNARWLRQDLFKKAKKKGIKIYVRSIFLQGLLLTDMNSGFWEEKKVVHQMMELHEIAQRLGYSMAQLAVNYSNSIEGVEQYLVGCETEKQISENVMMSRRMEKVPPDICSQIQKISSSVEKQIIDPRKWRN